jgi:hypothetical protein
MKHWSATACVLELQIEIEDGVDIPATVGGSHGGPVLGPCVMQGISAFNSLHLIFERNSSIYNRNNCLGSQQTNLRASIYPGSLCISMSVSANKYLGS